MGRGENGATLHALRAPSFLPVIDRVRFPTARNVSPHATMPHPPSPYQGATSRDQNPHVPRRSSRVPTHSLVPTMLSSVCSNCQSFGG